MKFSIFIAEKFPVYCIGKLHGHFRIISDFMGVVKELKNIMLQGDPQQNIGINLAATGENRSSGFPTRSDTNRPVQPQRMARSLKVRI